MNPAKFEKTAQTLALASVMAGLRHQRGAYPKEDIALLQHYIEDGFMSEEDRERAIRTVNILQNVGRRY